MSFIHFLRLIAGGLLLFPAPVTGQDPAAGLAEGAGTAETSKGTTTFVAYNLRNYFTRARQEGGGFAAGEEQKPKPPAEIERVVKTIAALKPDLLGVCEIGTEDDLRDLQARLKVAGCPLPHFEHAGGGDPNRHLGFLTRLPIIARHSQRQLVYEMGAKVLPMQRGILDVTVRINEFYDARFLGAHLKSKREADDGDQALMRRFEAMLLRKHAQNILAADPRVNLMVYGDMNDTRESSIPAALAGVRGAVDFLDDISLADEHGQRWTHYWKTADSYSRLDYVFVSKGLRPEILTKKMRDLV